MDTRAQGPAGNFCGSSKGLAEFAEGVLAVVLLQSRLQLIVGTCPTMLAFGFALAKGSFGGKSGSAHLAGHKARAAYQASV